MISKLLENRSEHAVKNRYNGLIFKNVKCSREDLRKYEERKIVKRYKVMIEKKLKATSDESKSENEAEKE